jgi:hypothetical protein
MFQPKMDYRQETGIYETSVFYYWTQKSHAYPVDGGSMFLRNFCVRPSTRENDDTTKAITV